MLWSPCHHDALLTPVAACWVRKHELSTLASRSDMHRTALSAHSQDGFSKVHLFSMQKCLPCFAVAVQQLKSHFTVDFATHKENRMCNMKQQEGSVHCAVCFSHRCTSNQYQVQMSHPMGLLRPTATQRTRHQTQL